MWLYKHWWMISTSLNHCKEMGAQQGRRSLRMPAEKLGPVIVGNTCYCTYLHSSNYSWLGQPVFWPKNLNFWVYNIKILTVSWPINFMCLQLQTNSVLGVEVHSEAYSCTPCFELKKNCCLNLALIYLKVH